MVRMIAAFPVYMRGYPSKEERDKRLKAAHDGPEFAEVVTSQERNPDMRLIVKARNIDPGRLAGRLLA